MSWNYPRKNIVAKIVRVKYSQIINNTAKESIFNQLGSPVFVENSKSQSHGFREFLGK